MSHVLLYKMFSPTLDSSLGIQMWFISTIIQLYLVFIPLHDVYAFMQRRYKRSGTIFLACAILISALWHTLVYVSGHSAERIWNSFFLSYLWEFCLGMLLAEVKMRTEGSETPHLRLGSLFIVLILSSVVFFFLAKQDNILKMFDDPWSLISYTSLAIIIYRINIEIVTKAILSVSRFSYELYLLHILIFKIIFGLFKTGNLIFISILAFVTALISSYVFHEVVIDISHFANEGSHAPKTYS